MFHLPISILRSWFYSKRLSFIISLLTRFSDTHSIYRKILLHLNYSLPVFISHEDLESSQREFLPYLFAFIARFLHQTELQRIFQRIGKVNLCFGDEYCARVRLKRKRKKKERKEEEQENVCAYYWIGKRASSRETRVTKSAFRCRKKLLGKQIKG